MAFTVRGDDMNIYLIDLTCSTCEQTDTQTVINTHTEPMSQRVQRVRVDTKCTCGAIHWYTLKSPAGVPVMVFQNDLLEIPF